jgi:hypothetical protein
MFNQSNQPTKFENFSHLEIEISNSQRRSVWRDIFFKGFP